MFYFFSPVMITIIKPKTNYANKSSGFVFPNLDNNLCLYTLWG